MNIAKTIDPRLVEDSLNNPETTGATHHGYSFEDFVISALGFTEEDGTPYRSVSKGGSATWNQPFDIPKEVVARNPIIPKSLQGNWSCKAPHEDASTIGLGMASEQYDAWARDGIVQCNAFYRVESNGYKTLTYFGIHKIEPSRDFWGNLSKKKIASIDPMVRKDKSVSWSKEATKDMQKTRDGIIGLRNISREAKPATKWRESRSLQCYMTMNNYKKLIA